MFSKAIFLKRKKLDYYMKLPPFSFLEDKPLDFILNRLHESGFVPPREDLT